MRCDEVTNYRVRPRDIERALDVGHVIRAFRKKHGLTQTQLAEAIGVGQSTIVRWESGSEPRVEAFRKLRVFAESLGDSIPWLWEPHSATDRLMSMISDPDLAEIALVVGCSRSVVIATWSAILESAAGLDDGGRFDISPRRVAVILLEPVDTVAAVFREMAAMRLVTAEVGP